MSNKRYTRNLIKQNDQALLKNYFYQIRVTNHAKTIGHDFSGDHGATAAAETAVLPHLADQEAASYEFDVQVKIATWAVLCTVLKHPGSLLHSFTGTLMKEQDRWHLLPALSFLG